jgi:RNA polymerase sigma-70 factor, ECF subfamily
MSEEIEAAARQQCQAGDLDAALKVAITGYGEEVFSFVVARMRDEDAAGDVFSQACEDLLRTLPSFEWRCSLRTWFYRIARSAASRYQRSPMNRPERRVALSHVSELVDHVRSRTVAHLRSDVKDQMRTLREQLDADEQQLLFLRIDQDLSWNEIAEIVGDEGDDDAAVQRTSARLRQQFQKLKDRLRELAIAAGLLPSE